jgi:hypothetical protein
MRYKKPIDPLLVQPYKGLSFTIIQVVGIFIMILGCITSIFNEAYFFLSGLGLFLILLEKTIEKTRKVS